MVREFTELQGMMGGLYAKQEGQPEPVWKAIYYHYLPVGVEADAPPSRAELGSAAIAWAAVALADKSDSVLALFYAGERFSGSRDPYGMRRQMQGIVRILIDLPELTGLDLEVSIDSIFAEAAKHLPMAGARWQDVADPAFVLDRIRFALEARGSSVEIARAAAAPGESRPLRARRVAQALDAMRASADFQALAVLFKRVKNIAKELREAGGRGPGAGRSIDRTALKEPAERALLDELDRRRPAIEQATAAGDYRRAFAEIAAFRPAVDRFFTDVFVMVDDASLRNARLTLMAELRDLVLGLADISEIVPQETEGGRTSQARQTES
jgi:glycyl-tRNA synthetase beta chain